MVPCSLRQNEFTLHIWSWTLVRWSLAFQAPKGKYSAPLVMIFSLLDNNYIFLLVLMGTWIVLSCLICHPAGLMIVSL